MRRLLLSVALAGAFVPAASGSLAQAADGCPNAVVRAQQGSEELPDCRAYEQATPVDKGGNDASFPVATFSSDDGDRLVYGADGSGSFAGSSNGIVSQFVAARDGQGWVSHPLSAKTRNQFQVAAAVGLVDFACDLCESAVGAQFESDAAGDNDPSILSDGSPDVYVSDGRGGFDWISGGEIGGTAPYGARYAGRDRAGKHLAFDVADALLPEASVVAQGVSIAYEKYDGATRIVGRDDAGAVMAGGSVIGNGFAEPTLNAVSADGSRIFFRSPEPAAGNASHLYLRTDGARTVEVSRPHCTVPSCDGTGAVSQFVGASSSGDVVYFSSFDALVDNDTNGDADLYKYNVTDQSLTRISRGWDGIGGIGGVSDMLGVSDDGSTVYFSSAAVLTNVSSRAGEDPVAGTLNTYVYRASTGDVDFVGGYQFPGNYGGEGARPISLTSDGDTLVFAGYPNTSANYQAQVYRYTARDRLLECLSCAQPDAVSALFSRRWRDQTAGAIVQGATPFRRARNVSADGSTVFFESDGALVAQDTNGRRDVYRWHGGDLALISSGLSDEDSYFIDASADGRDVFFSTYERLTPSDRDGAVDIYTARVDGGLLLTPPSACGEDACQGSPAVPPGLPSAGSITFSGPGNLPAQSPRPSLAKVTVAKVKAVTGSVAALRVRVPSAGRVSVSGSSIRRASRSVTKAGEITIKIALTAKAAKALKQQRSVKAKVRVVFRPATGGSASTSVTATFKASKAKAGRARAASLSAGAKGGR